MRHSSCYPKHNCGAHCNPNMKRTNSNIPRPRPVPSSTSNVSTSGSSTSPPLARLASSNYSDVENIAVPTPAKTKMDRLFNVSFDETAPRFSHSSLEEENQKLLGTISELRAMKIAHEEHIHDAKKVFEEFRRSDQRHRKNFRKAKNILGDVTTYLEEYKREEVDKVKIRLENVIIELTRQFEETMMLPIEAFQKMANSLPDDLLMDVDDAATPDESVARVVNLEDRQLLRKIRDKILASSRMAFLVEDLDGIAAIAILEKLVGVNKAAEAVEKVVKQLIDSRIKGTKNRRFVQTASRETICAGRHLFGDGKIYYINRN